ncbi:MAG: hypothetical protein IKU22_04225 [Alistipes sp.]|nr:hypothetical protein [Alistipes sp.]
MNKKDYTMRHSMNKNVVKKQFEINPQKVESWLKKNKTKSLAKDSNDVKYMGGCMTIPFG